MLIDANLVMSDAQAVTVTAASTSYVDQAAQSDAITPGSWVEFLIDTAFTGNSATIAFTLETDSDSAFGTAVLLFSSGAITDTTLVAGYRPARFHIPLGAKRYIRAKYVVTGTAVAGKIDCRIVDAVDANLP